MKQVKRRLFSINGPEFSNEEHGSAGLCSSKTSKSLHMDFTSQLPVTSGHCTVWQKPGHDAGQEHSNAPTQCSYAGCIHVKRISGCYASRRGKSLSCGTTHSTGCAHKSSGILVGDIDGGGHSERRKPAGKGAKGIPPRREVISAPFGTRRCQNGVSPNSVKCCSITKSGLLRAGPV